VRILIVDDDASVRSAMIRLLEHHGHSTCWASSGEGAIRLLETEPLDLVLLDLVLGPVGSVSGWDVARHKAHSRKAARIPFIIVSGLDAHEATESIEVNPLAGAILFLGKPVDIDVLLKVIATLQAAQPPPVGHP
jgi:CheY-like chemotaxis protein